MRKFAANTEQSTLATMASLSDRTTLIDQIVEELHTQAKGASKPLNLVALASFLPELTAAREPMLQGGGPPPLDQASKAVVFLIQLARNLRRRFPKGKGPGVVELVAGSRIDGLWCGEPQSEDAPKTPVYFAKQVSRRDAIKRLCAQLARVAQAAELKAKDDIVLALELEPGPLYVLNDIEALCIAYDELAQAGLLDRIGFNLDVSHWALSGMCPRQVLDNLRNEPGKRVLPKYPMTWRNLMDQVVHSHISDHGQGHFGDCGLCELGLGSCDSRACTKQVFREWLAVIAYAAGDRHGVERHKAAPRFSGYVSLELEACASQKVIDDSVESLKALLAGG